MEQIVLIGDSWSCGEWIHCDSNSIKLNHPGITEYLPFKTINLSKSGASNWQSLYAMFNYMNQYQHIDQDYSIILFQTDPTRPYKSETFDVDIDSVITKVDSLKNLYSSLVEIFYIKISELASQFKIPVYIIGGLSDVDQSIFSLYNNSENIVCSSWVNLLYADHKNNVIPLQFNSELYTTAKKLGRLDLCNEILDINEQNFMEFNEVIGLDTFGPALGDFHPSRKGHRILAEHIIKFLETKTDA